MFNSSILLNIILLPLIGAIIILFTRDTNVKLIKNVALVFSMASFVLSTFLWVLFDRSTAKFQFVEEFYGYLHPISIFLLEWMVFLSSSYS